MSALRDLQTQLQMHLLEDDLEIVKQVVPPLKDSSEVRLQIYNHAYHARLLEALNKEYEVLHQWIGDDAFFDMAYAYIENYPSRYFSIDKFTQHLSEFLAKTEPYAQQPYLSELAYLISVLGDTIIAPDASVIGMDDIATISHDAWANMRLRLHPSVQVITHHWNILAVWKALTENQAPPTPMQMETLSYYVVWRKGIQSFYIALNAQEAVVLQSLQQGLSFGELCEALTQFVAAEEVAQQVVNILIQFLHNGMLSEVTL